MKKIKKERLFEIISLRLGGYLTELLHRDIRNTFFIIGFHGSGKSLLRSLLHENSDLAVYPSEALHLWHPQTFPWYLSRIDNLPPIWYDQSLYSQISLERRSVRDSKRLKSTFLLYKLLACRKIFVQECGLIAFMIPYVKELFPDARFIHVVRDGRVAVFKFALKEKDRMEYYKDKIRNSINKRYLCTLNELLYYGSGYWNNYMDSIQKIKKQFDHSILHEVSYEELCNNQKVALDKINSFMGIECNNASKQGKKILNENGPVSGNIDQKVWSELTELMGRNLKLHSYI